LVYGIYVVYFPDSWSGQAKEKEAQELMVYEKAPG